MDSLRATWGFHGRRCRAGCARWSTRGSAEEGARVPLTYADEADARRVATESGDRADARVLDVTSEADWEDVAAWAFEGDGRVDVLVNNAGIFLAAKLEDTTLEEFRR